MSPWSNWLTYHPFKVKITGSIPVGRTIFTDGLKGYFYCFEKYYQGIRVFLLEI